MFNIIIIANQTWAQKVYEPVSRHPRVTISQFCKNEGELSLLDLKTYDLLITVGLSSRLSDSIYGKIFTIGLHCAEFDRYSAGTPLQNQIIDGILRTKHRIFPITPIGLKHEDSQVNRQVLSTEYSHEVDLCLHGSIEDIFNQLTYTSISLLNMFLDEYPHIEWKNWGKESTFVKRRVQADSKIAFKDLSEYNTLKLYNLIRSLGDPYPNFAIEDEKGILYIKEAVFRSKE
jgi:hypothetical protein